MAREPLPFNQFNLHPKLLETARHLGFEHATLIQEKCIPKIQQGMDVMGQSGTGSGKTVAFALPILEKISSGRGMQAFILTPTRELCVQVAGVFEMFGKGLKVSVACVYGGVGIGSQIDQLKRADIVVATPGRTLDHMERRTIDFRNVKFLVLDEADKMFEMGFFEPVEEIIRHLPKERQTLLFSATIPSKVNNLMRRYLKNPVIERAEDKVDPGLLKQVYYDLKNHEKFSLLVHLLKHKTPGLALVFCATRHEVDIVARNLKMHGIKAGAIHGGITQNKREDAMDSLRNEDSMVLVATDVAARGLDIKNISHVYNYDTPLSSETYTHRIGRTARAGEEGEAVTLLTEKDHDNFRRVLSDRSNHVERGEVPNFEHVEFVRHSSSDQGGQRGRLGFGNRPRRFGQGGRPNSGRPQRSSGPAKRGPRTSRR